MIPYRELAYQIADQFRVFGRHIGLKDAVIVGGVGKLVPVSVDVAFTSLQALWNLQKRVEGTIL